MAEARRDYSTEEITVHWNAARCIHSARCLQGLPEVFDRGARPWIRPDRAAAERIAEVIERCPSGALHYTWRIDRSPETPPERPIIEVRPNGPLYVRGAIEIRRPDGSVRETDTRVSLCRCGQSSQKPYCDNTHRSIGFQAE